MGQVKKYTERNVDADNRPSSTDAPEDQKVSPNPQKSEPMAEVNTETKSSATSAPTMENAKNRISEILAQDSDDDDALIAAALSKAENLVGEARSGSGLSK